MAQEILVIYKEPLTRDMIEAGSAFLEALERHDFEFTAAFWLYESERNQWRMMLGVPNVRDEGRRKSYRRIFDIMRKESLDQSVRENIAVVDAKDPLVLSLRKALGKESGVRYAGREIEDAYVYRTAA
jgi:hypothetical protein